MDLSKEGLVRICNFLFWSLAIVVSYGLYEFFAAIFGYPFLNLVTVPSYGLEVAPWAKDLARDFSGVYLPRPRSTVGEPLDFASYILFSVPFAAITISFTRDKLFRLLKAFTIFATGIAFIVNRPTDAALVIMYADRAIRAAITPATLPASRPAADHRFRPGLA